MDWLQKLDSHPMTMLRFTTPGTACHRSVQSAGNCELKSIIVWQAPYKRDTDIVRQEGREADLVLCLGGNLSGSTAEIVNSAAGRSQTGLPYGGGGALGTILVRTTTCKYDSTATLKFNCTADALVKRLVDRYDILGDVSKEAVTRRMEQETEALQREKVLACLQEAEEYEADDPRVRHGRLFNSTCLLQPSASKEGLWKDEPTVVERKVSALKDLVRMSKRTVVYTEAVTQEAPLGHYGTGQCALSHKQDVKTLPSDKVPPSYQGLARLAHAGLIHAWVQLGHDGLPQKCGFPGPIREVYDSWRDHHKDGYKEELNVVDAELGQADLVLVVTFGSTFSGSSAKVVSQVAGRMYGSIGRCLGLVVLGQAETGLDALATVRLNLTPEEAVSGLVTKLGDVPRVKEKAQMPVQLQDTATEVVSVGGGRAVTQCSYATNAEKEEACEEDVERRQACHSPCPTPDTSHRAQVTDCLSGTPSIPPGDPRLPHGRLLSNTCLETPKDGRDREAMLDYKFRRLADLMRLSKKTILYMDATTTTTEGFDSKKAITYCEVKWEKLISRPTHPNSCLGHG